MRSLLKTIFILNFFLCLSVSFGQDQNEVNRLLRIVNTQAADTTTVNALNDLAWQYSKTDAPKAINFAMQAQKLSISLAFERGRITSMVRVGQTFVNQKEYEKAEKIFLEVLEDETKENDPYGIARAQSALSEVYINKGALNKALDYGLKALEIFEEIKSKASIALIANKIGTIYEDMGEYDKAMEYFIKGLDIREQLGNKKNIAYSYLDIGIFYKTLADFPKAIDYLGKSEAIFKESDDQSGLAKVYINLGNVYFEMKYYNTALQRYKKSLLLKEQLGLTDKDAGIYNNIGLVYHRKRELNTALAYYQKSISIHQKNTGGNMFTDAYINISDLYYIEEDYEQAVAYYKEALELAEKSDKKLTRLKILNNLSDSYAKLEQHAAALKYSKAYIKLNKDIEDSYKVAMRLIANYEEQQKENAILESENKRKSTIIYSLIAGLLLIGLLSFSILRGKRQKQRAEIAEKERESAAQKAAIAEKDRELAGQKIEELLRKQELKSINAMIEGQEKERRRIAQDLHDRLGGMLAMVKIHYKSVEENIENLKAANKTQYNKANALLDEACEEVRKVAHDMVSGVLMKFGLVAALENLRDTLELEQANQLSVEFIAHGIDDRLDNNIEIQVYRIVQELINNILKHAKAKEVTIQLIKSRDGLNVTVEDDGVGFDRSKTKGFGMGLTGIASRVDNLQGELNIDSTPGNGTTVTIDIPLLND